MSSLTLRKAAVATVRPCPASRAFQNAAGRRVIAARAAEPSKVTEFAVHQFFKEHVHKTCRVKYLIGETKILCSVRKHPTS